MHTTAPTRALVNAVCVDHSWTLNSSMSKPAAPLKPPEDTTLAYMPFWEELKRADPGMTDHGTKGLTETPSRPADMFTTAAVP